MRGIETRIQDIRHMVFTEVAKMAYQEETWRTSEMTCSWREPS